MILSYEQITSIVQGVARVHEKEDGIHFHRFTKEQEEGYDGSDFHPKQYGTAGVRLHFKTDSKTLYMKVLTSEASLRPYFAHDIVVNGKLIGSLELIAEQPYGEFEKTFELGEGIKDVCIHFPWSVCSVLKELRLDDNSLVEPVKKDKKILIYGDSITQGYDSENPSYRYAGRLADALDAEEINKAIGAEKFCPWLAELKDDIEPDYICVAYGTNHWHRSKKEEFREICDKFYGNLVKSYPNAKIFALTPIWRKDCTDKTNFDYFGQIGEIIADVVKKYDNVICISGFDFVPQDETLYKDLFLHPNNKGFSHYADSVCKAIKEYV